MQQPHLGRRILALRLRSDLSAEHLGRRAGVSGATVSRIETGKIHAPSYEILLRLATALGFDSVDAMLAAGGPAPLAVPIDPATVPEVLDAEGRPGVPYAIEGGHVVYLPQGIDPAGVDEARLAAIRGYISEVLREVVREEVRGVGREVMQEALRDVGGEVVRREIRRAWLGHKDDSAHG